MFPVWRLTLSLLLAASPALAATNATFTFAGDGTNLPKKTILTVRVFDLQSLTTAAPLRFRAKPRLTLPCDFAFCQAVISAAAFEQVKGKRVAVEYFAVTKAFGATVVDTKKSKIIKLVRRKLPRISPSSFALHSTRRLAGEPVVSGDMRIGVPPDAFTASGSGAAGVITRGAAPVTITRLVQAPCYNQPGSHVVIEADPRVLEARQKEFDLVRQGYVDPDSAIPDLYTPPNHAVRGHIQADGGNFTATVELTNQAGVVVKSSVANSSDSFVDAVDQAAGKLATDLCNGAKVLVETYSCTSEPCRCCQEPNAFCFGKRYLPRMKGTVKLPVNGVLVTNFPAFAGIPVTCPSLSVIDCSPLTCCQRTSSDQPETSEWELNGEFPFPIIPNACICPLGTPPPQWNFVAQARNTMSSGSHEMIIDGVPCQ